MTTSSSINNNAVSTAYDGEYTSNQQVILALIPIFSGFLSLVGSSTIIYMVLTRAGNALSTTKSLANNGGSVATSFAHRSTINRSVASSDSTSSYVKQPSNKKKPLSSYERILLGLSVSTGLISIRAILTTFPMPSGTPGKWQAHGNMATCSAQGFLTQLGFAATLYWASLSIFFALSIRPKIGEERIAKVYEPFLHIIPIGFAISTAISGLIMGMYNPIPLALGCWLGSYPYECQLENSTVPCTRGVNATEIMWYFGGYIVIISYAIVIVCMLTIYLSVRNQIRKMEMRFSASVAISGSTSAASHRPSNEHSKGQRKRLQQISTQAFLYIGTFLLTYLGPSVSRIMDSGGNRDGFFIVALGSQIFYPLQGFLIFFIYIRPRYNDLRRHNTNLSHIGTIKTILGFHQSSTETQHQTPQSRADVGNNNSSMYSTTSVVVATNDCNGMNKCISDDDDDDFEDRIRGMNLSDSPKTVGAATTPGTTTLEEENETRSVVTDTEVIAPTSYITKVDNALHDVLS